MTWWKRFRSRWRAASTVVIAGAIALANAAAAPTSARVPEGWPAELRTPDRRVAAVRAFAVGITRNDAEAIDAGWSGRKGWRAAVGRAMRDAGKVRDPFSFGLVLRRLYAAYPSLHSHLDLRRDLDIRTVYGAPYLPFTLKADRVGPRLVPRRVYVAAVAADRGGMTSGGPMTGDEVVGIDGQPIGVWLSRSPNVCRRNSLWQCYGDFDAQLRNELLGWDRRRSLRLDLLRDRRELSVDYRPIAAPERQAGRPKTSCVEDDMHYDGFEQVFSGFNLCVFRKVDDHAVEVWRLKSFSYPVAGPVTSVRSEVDGFWAAHWKAASASVRTLVIDVSGNGGGDVPMPWYSLIFARPFQEQYARYLRLPEYDDPAILAQEVDDAAHARWFDALRRKRPGLWRRVGAYLPPVAQFCAPADADCRGWNFQPLPHRFGGTVSIIVDDNCVSSCSGFTWNVLRVLGRRAAAFGLPDSGDSNFKRAPLKLGFDGGNWRATVARASTDDHRSLATANVMVTRTTTSKGRVISGHSNWVTRVVDRRWNDGAARWSNRVLTVIQQARDRPAPARADEIRPGRSTDQARSFSGATLRRVSIPLDSPNRGRPT